VVIFPGDIEKEYENENEVVKAAALAKSPARWQVATEAATRRRWGGVGGFSLSLE
jgi:hypothetical protein